MTPFNVLLNLDLLSVGATVAAMLVLGFLVVFHNRSSTTARAFFMFCLATALWSVANYMQYNIHAALAGLWAIRAIVFIAVWHAYWFLVLCYVYPRAEVSVPRFLTRVMFPLAWIVSFLTLTPLVFEGASSVSNTGVVTAVHQGPAIIAFAGFAAFCIIGGIGMLVRKGFRSEGAERQQILIVAIGMLTTFLCIAAFNIIMPLVFENTRFLPLSALTIVPFIAAVAYAIGRHGLFQIKVAASGALVFALALTSFSEIVFAQDTLHVFFRVGVFMLILAAGILLIRSVLHEVEQREKVQLLSDEKSEFLTFASHEIRNPITAIRGYASLIYDGTTGEINKETRAAAQKILVRGDDVLALIAQFLSQSKLELGKITYTITAFDCATVVRALTEEFRPHADAHGLTLMQDIPDPHPLMITADQAKLREVLGNLIDNSLKYTKEGGVTISCARHAASVRITVSDTGVGIPSDVMPKLFGKFTRADAAKANLFGTGVGLYLGKQFIEGMGGRIWAESDGPGKGSRFIIEFPLVT